MFTKKNLEYNLQVKMKLGSCNLYCLETNLKDIYPTKQLCRENIIQLFPWSYLILVSEKGKTIKNFKRQSSISHKN